MDIRSIIDQIPEDSTDEALMAIDSIKIEPTEQKARLVCHLTHKFRLWVRVLPAGAVSVEAEGLRPAVCHIDDLLPTLKRRIYEIDELISEGQYTQKPVASPFIADDRPPAPAYMDIPVWDEKRGRWYDAEY